MLSKDPDSNSVTFQGTKTDKTLKWEPIEPKEVIRLINNALVERLPWHNWYLHLHETHNPLRRYWILTRDPSLDIHKEHRVRTAEFDLQTSSYDDVEHFTLEHIKFAHPSNGKEVTLQEWMGEHDTREDSYQTGYPCHQCSTQYKACGSDNVCPTCMGMQHTQWRFEQDEYASFNFMF